MKKNADFWHVMSKWPWNHQLSKQSSNCLTTMFHTVTS